MADEKKVKVKLHGVDGGRNGAGARDADFSQLDEAAEAAQGEEQTDESAAEPPQPDLESVDPSAEHIAKLEGEVAELKDKYLRSLAELENVRKRELRERSELLKYQGDRLVTDLLPVLDNLELALSHKDADPQQLKTGLEMIQKMFVDALGKWGIRAVSGMGEQFDPTRFAAISKMPSKDAAPGVILAEARKAYFYKDKLLRVGEVVVASEPPASAEAAGDKVGDA